MEVKKKASPGRSVPLAGGYIDVLAIRGNTVVLAFRGYSEHIQVVKTATVSNNQPETSEQFG